MTLIAPLRKLINEIECLPRRIWHKVDILLACGAENKEKGGGIAIVRIGGIGDMLLALPLFFLLKTENEKVTLICRESFCHMKGIFSPFVDDFIFYNKDAFRKNIFYRMRILRTVSAKGFDKIIQSGISRQQGEADVICWAAKASTTVGFFPRPWNTHENRLSNDWFDTLIDGEYGVLHESERMVKLSGQQTGLQKCGDVFSLYSLPAIKIGRGHENGYAAICIGSSVSVREWGTHNFVRVAKMIQKETGLLPVFIGTQKDKKTVVGARLDFPHDDLVGKLNFDGFVACLKNSDLIICNESAPMHFGSFLKKPTVAIVSGGEFNNYCKYPYSLSKNLLVVHAQDQACFNCGWECIYKNADDKPFPCLSQVTSDYVCDKIKSWELFRNINRL